MPDLLFLTQRIPYPPDKGEKIRPLWILRYLAERYRIHLGCFVDDPRDWRHVPTVRDMCATSYFAGLNRTWAKVACLRGLITGRPLSCTFFWDRALAGWVNQTLARVRPEAVFICSSAMGQFVLGNPHMPKRSIMDFADVDSDKWRQYAQTARVPMRWIFTRESRVLLDHDRRVARETTASTFVTEPEADLFRKLAPESAARTFSVVSGVDCDYFAPTHQFETPYDSPGPHFVFTGTMDYWPNIQAVTWFVENVLPLIRHDLPKAEFFIVGSNPAADVMRLSGLPGVTVTGRVADVRPYLGFAAAAVAPLWIGRGIQNKVLEAMAMARATIVTPPALEGIDAIPGHELILADSAQAFAQACLWAARDPAVQEIGRAARRRVVADFKWRARLKGFDPLLA